MGNQSFNDRLIDASYRLFGNLIPNIAGFKKDYHKSGMRITFESYMALATTVTLITCAASFAVAFLLQSLARLPLNQSLLGAVILAFISSMIALICFVAYPFTRISHNKNEIDSNLIYTVGYMSVLAAGGISIERIFDRVVEVERHSAIRNLALRFVTNVKVFGSDVASSLADIQNRSPSEVFSKLMLSVGSTAKTSGDLKNLLMFETSHLLSLKREQLKKRLSSMVALAEIYVTAMVMAPITFIIMITLLSVMGGASGGLSPISQLNLIVFFGIPVICVVFIVILDGALPKED